MDLDNVPIIWFEQWFQWTEIEATIFVFEPQANESNKFPEGASIAWIIIFPVRWVENANDEIKNGK